MPTNKQKQTKKDRELNPDERIKAENAKKAAAIDAKVKEEKLKTQSASWTKSQDAVFVRLFGEKLSECNKTVDTATLKAHQWNALVKAFNAETGVKYTKVQCQNRMKTLKKDYKIVHHLLSLSGFGWNDENKIVTAPDEVWDDLLVKFPTHEKWKTRRLELYDELHEIFCGTHATGLFAVSANDEAESIFPSNDDDDGESDDDDMPQYVDPNEG